MSPEHIITLANAEREYQYAFPNGWTLTVRLPERRLVLHQRG
jgi:hypothetical protein